MMMILIIQLDYGRMIVLQLRKNALDTNIMVVPMNVLMETLSGEPLTLDTSTLKPTESDSTV
jgi:hypothetical protein